MAEDKVAVDVDASGAKLEVSGDAAGRLAHQIADLLSPFSELAGAAGDKLRIWRQTALIKALEHAHTVANETGVEFRPVAPKFLVNWIEAASLEEDGELSKKWGKLLLNSMGAFDSESLWAAGLLSEMGGKEAKYLDDLASRSGFNFSNDENVNAAIFSYEAVSRQQYETLYNAVYHEILEGSGFQDMQVRANQFLLEKIQKMKMKTHPIGFHWVHSQSEDFGIWLSSPIESEFQIEFLCSKNLADKSSFGKTNLKHRGTGHFEYLRLTSLGYRFLRKVH